MFSLILVIKNKINKKEKPLSIYYSAQEKFILNILNSIQKH